MEVRLPLAPDALISAESQVDVFVDQLRMGRDESLAFALRHVVNEGFRHALHTQPLEGRLRIVSLSLRGSEEGVWVSITEPGRGFDFKGAFPPYPSSLIGDELCFATASGQDLIAKVSGPARLFFRAEPHLNGKPRETGKIRDLPGVAGLLTLCHECEEVNMTYDAISGNSLNVFYPVRLEDSRAAVG